MLYIAYGSNMNRRQMARRCPKARPLAAIWLQGWRLVMKRVADIEPDPHALTPAALWEITRSCERALDAYGAGRSGQRHRSRCQHARLRSTARDGEFSHRPAMCRPLLRP